MNVIDQYPSTADLPRIMGAQDDPVLLMPQGARKRYKRAACDSGYIRMNGEVCAVGAVMREAGVNAITNNAFVVDIDAGLGPVTSVTKALKRYEIEASIIRNAKEAIKLLNASAKELYPASKHYKADAWSGPLEWVNQTITPFSEAKKAVVKIYTHAIKQRMVATGVA